MKAAASLSAHERSLLLFIEQATFRDGGLFSPRPMSQADWALLSVWRREGLVDYGQVPNSYAWWVRMPDSTWNVALELRRLVSEESIALKIAERPELAYGNLLAHREAVNQARTERVALPRPCPLCGENETTCSHSRRS